MKTYKNQREGGKEVSYPMLYDIWHMSQHVYICQDLRKKIPMKEIPRTPENEADLLWSHPLGAPEASPGHPRASAIKCGNHWREEGGSNLFMKVWLEGRRGSGKYGQACSVLRSAFLNLGPFVPWEHALVSGGVLGCHMGVQSGSPWHAVVGVVVVLLDILQCRGQPPGHRITLPPAPGGAGLETHPSRNKFSKAWFGL